MRDGADNKPYNSAVSFVGHRPGLRVRDGARFNSSGAARAHPRPPANDGTGDTDTRDASAARSAPRIQITASASARRCAARPASTPRQTSTTRSQRKAETGRGHVARVTCAHAPSTVARSSPGPVAFLYAPRVRPTPIPGGPLACVGRGTGTRCRCRCGCRLRQ
jgi:hypothetical protein